MRMCINALGKDGDVPAKTCAFMRLVYDGFQRLSENACGRETKRKVDVMRQSLRKVEDGELVPLVTIPRYRARGGRFECSSTHAHRETA